MKSEEWKTYRTRFLVKAKQLSSHFTFVDHLGRQHCGGKGDYLVESSDGVLSIAPRRIFEDIYVSMSNQDTQVGEPVLDRHSFQPLEIEAVSLEKSPVTRKPTGEARVVERVEPVRERRKLPESYRERRGSTQFVRLM
jgi:hypothetical protein